jgi:hypothetical protein
MPVDDEATADPVTADTRNFYKVALRTRAAVSNACCSRGPRWPRRGRRCVFPPGEHAAHSIGGHLRIVLDLGITSAVTRSGGSVHPTDSSRAPGGLVFTIGRALMLTVPWAQTR